MDKRSIPGGVLGIIGVVFAFIGGLMLVACASIVDDLGGGASYKILSIIFGIGGAIVGLVGCIFSFKKAIIGGALQLVALVFLIIAGATVAWAVMNIIAMVLFGVGGILSFVVKK